MSYKVKTIPKFDKELKRLAKKYPSLKNEYFELIQELKQHPEQGTAMGNNCYKIRLGIDSKGKGKSGGCKGYYLFTNYRYYRFSALHL